MPSPESSTNIALTEAIGRPRTVLDVRCGFGFNGAAARNIGARVVGIESDPSRAAAARHWLDEVLELDYRDDKGVASALGDRRFDLILLSDGLELAVDPSALIEAYARYLEPEGHLIASFYSRDASKGRPSPVTSASNDSIDGGTPKVFREKEAVGLVERAGLQVLRVEHNPLIVRALRPLLVKNEWLGAPPGVDIQQAFRDLPVYRVYRAVVRPLEHTVASAFPELLSYQHIVVARRQPIARPLSLTVGMLTMDEEPSIARMLDGIRRVAPDAQILCIDSSLKDRTPVIAEQGGARVIRQLPPRGHGPAMELLMYEASKQSDALIYLDCDFTYPPDTIPVIRRILEQGADVVNAARTRQKPEAMPMLNYMANRSFALTSQLVHGVPAADLHSGMRGYRSSVIRAFAFDGEGDALPIDTLLFPAKCGYDVVEIGIPYHERIGSSKLRKMAGTAWTFIRIGKAIGVGSRRHYRYDVRDSGAMSKSGAVRDFAHWLEARARGLFLLEAVTRKVASFTEDQQISLRRCYDAGIRRAKVANELSDDPVAALVLYRDAAPLFIAAIAISRDASVDVEPLLTSSAWDTLAAMARAGKIPVLPRNVEETARILQQPGTLAFDAHPNDDALARRTTAESGVRWLARLVEPRTLREIRATRMLRIAAAGLALFVALAFFASSLFHPTNIALHKPVTVSARHPASSAPADNSGLTNGEIEATYGVHTTAGPSWVMVDLLAVYKVGTIKIYNRADGWLDEGLPFALELSEDGEKFTIVNNRTETFSHTVPWVFDATGKRARYIRVSSNSYTALCELEAFGKK